MAKKNEKSPAKPLRGYPCKKQFQTMEEVDAYFDCDELTCLLCGRPYTALHKHLRMSHDMQADDYKEMYGIPWRRGLISRTLKEKQAAIMNRQRKEGILPQAPSKEHIKKLTKVSVKNRRPITQAARNYYSRHALNAHGRTEKWGKPDFEEYLKRIKSGRTITEVGKDKDMPSREVFDKYCRENPAFQKKFDKTWNALPFDVQVRGQKTGPRLKKKVVALRAKGLSWPEIAKVMGIKVGTARGTWFRLKKKGELRKYLK